MLSSPLLTSPKLSLQFKTSAPPPPHVRLHRPLAAATTAHSYTSTASTCKTSTFLNSNPMASCATLYEVLGIPTGASSQEIKTAYRRLARIFHPDVVAIDRKDSSADEFIKIHAAYYTLSDPQKRAVYDQNLFLFRRRRPLTTMSGNSGYSGRNWETDQCW